MFVNVVVLENACVYVKLTGTPDETTFESEFLVPAIVNMLIQRKPFLLFIDASDVTSVKLRIGKRMAHYMRTNREDLAQYLRGTTLLATNKIVTNLIDLVFRIQPPVAPFRVVTSPDEFTSALQTAVSVR
jgi:hypothetical protein